MSITKIVIEIGKKETTISLEEARQLYSELDKLFGNDTRFVPYQPFQPYLYRWTGDPVYCTSGTLTNTGDNGTYVATNRVTVRAVTQ